MEKTKGKEHMKIIGRYAGGHRYLILAGRALAGVSALLTLVPYYLLWKIIKTAAEGTGLDSIKTFAWQAVALTVIALLVYIAALLCTHIAAFRVDGMKNYTAQDIEAALKEAGFSKVKADHHKNKPWLTVLARK